MDEDDTYYFQVLMWGLNVKNPLWRLMVVGLSQSSFDSNWKVLHWHSGNLGQNQMKNLIIFVYLLVSVWLELFMLMEMKSHPINGGVHYLFVLWGMAIGSERQRVCTFALRVQTNDVCLAGSSFSPLQCYYLWSHSAVTCWGLALQGYKSIRQKNTLGTHFWITRHPRDAELNWTMYRVAQYNFYVSCNVSCKYIH